MKIKDYMCKECDCTDFFFADKGNQKGIYCLNCGKWLKWADKNEQNLAMQQEQETKKAQWIYDEDNNTVTCNYCHTWFYTHNRSVFMRYCPYCGLKMKSEE